MPVGSETRYFCGDEERRAALQRAIASGIDVNGIDFLEVLDSELEATPASVSRQRILLVQCFTPNGLAAIDPDRVRIDGGVRIAPIHIRWVHVLADVTAVDPPGVSAAERAFLAGYRAGEIDRDRILVVGTEERGDFSTYRFSLVEPGETIPLPGFDPRLAAIDFSFKVECPSDFDCKPSTECPPEAFPSPEIDYLAKDYTSFRRLMLDRMSAIVPGWKERNPADMGVALVELLAYVGDQLSYYQDAAATEAYLGAAKQRISIRRHARLVDYALGEGANARAWVAFEVEPGSDADGATLPAAGTRLLTRVPGQRAPIAATGLNDAIRSGSEVFESLTNVTLRASLNRLEFYTWSNRSCCLPAGATRATLNGTHPDLDPGMFLLFEEILGPNTGAPADADPRQRHVVRITRVEAGLDPVEQTPVTDIEWNAHDALPFPLCISAETGADHDSRYLPAVSVARGNVIVADHGLSVVEHLPAVSSDASGFRPRLTLGPLVHAAFLPEGMFAAFAAAQYSAADARPSVRLTTAAGQLWTPQRDLLSSDAFAQEFVAEIENDGRARLRFGDGVNGRLPASGTEFVAAYRIGLPEDGAVGTDSIAHIVGGPAGIVRVWNPLPAFGYRLPESVEEVRRYAPEAFRKQERAVTAEDYARATERHPEVQRASARFRWTGSWYTVFVSVDRTGGRAVDAEFAEEIRRHLNRFRMAGFDLEIRPPRMASLELRLKVCLEPGYERSFVKKALLDVFSNRRLASGKTGFFHPDNWTFGQNVYLSHIYEAASGVAGVHAVTVDVFKRWGRAAAAELDDGLIPIGDSEIARLDNDPSRRENGLIEIELEGGV